MGAVELSVCLVNWNTREELRQALDSVLASGLNPAAEVVVVDNASRDGSSELVRSAYPQVRLERRDSNLGYARGFNVAASLARGRYLLLLNPDTVVRPGALKALVDYLEAHPRTAAAGPKLVNPDGSLQYSCRRFPRLGAGLFRKTPLGWLLPGSRYVREYLLADWDHAEAREVDWVSGAAICLRREAWEEVGPLDEGFFMYCEDVDWCLRAWKAGWRIAYVPEAVIVHAIGRSSDLAPRRMILEFHRSMIRFYYKHYAGGYPGLLRGLPPVGIRLRAAFVLAGRFLRSHWRKQRKAGWR
jgi:hypothetical protein